MTNNSYDNSTFVIDDMIPGEIYNLGADPELMRSIRRLNRKNDRLQRRLRAMIIAAVVMIIATITLAIILAVVVTGKTQQMDGIRLEYEKALESVNSIEPIIRTVYIPASNDTVEENTDTSEVIPESNTSTISTPKPNTHPINGDMYRIIPLDKELKEYIYDSATEANIPPEVLFSLIWKESTFNADAKSTTNDHGLCQINEINFKELSKKFGYTEEEFKQEIYNPYTNVDSAIYLLSQYRDNYNNDNWHHVLMRYNLGPSGANKFFKSGTYSTEYSRAILDYAEECFNFIDIERGI